MSEAVVRVERGRLDRILRAVGGSGDRLLRNRTERVAELARHYAAPHGANMVNGIETRYPEPGKGEVISTHPASLFVIKGTKPHEIHPRNRKALRFNLGGPAGPVQFAKRVNHPGYKGDDFLTRALRDSR